MTPINFGILASSASYEASTSYQSIATTTAGAGGAATIDFTSIPSTYTHLQIRLLGRYTSTGNRDSILMRFNTDSGNNYWWHQIGANGTSASAENSGSAVNRGIIGTTSIPQDDAPASIYGVAVIDILDYANANKNKVTRGLAGQDQNTADGRLQFSSFVWNNTSAITSISLFTPSGNWKQYSSVALYGIKG
jgi:hypothetical protein